MSDDALFPRDDDPVAKQVATARWVLEQLNFDAERSNERSALVLLALLGLTPDSLWADVRNPLMRTVEIMDWIREHYDKDYKPNTRETIRRRTLHQFVEAMLIEHNPDDPERAVNSPDSCYRIHGKVLSVMRSVGEVSFAEQRQRYLVEIPGLRDLYARARDLHRIPVTLPDGSAVTLSPGGQNPLLKQMVEGFCEFFTPGGRVLYVGDAGAKWQVFERKEFAALGVTVDPHGKMPDLVVYMQDHDWLVLLEAASSHGPVDAKRYGELAHLFRGSTAGLVYVSCFTSREEMRGYLPQIAWETEAWCADNPTHLIHFNGERFLGPYST
jgi:hypothetical protein